MAGQHLSVFVSVSVSVCLGLPPAVCLCTSKPAGLQSEHPSEQSDSNVCEALNWKAVCVVPKLQHNGPHFWRHLEALQSLHGHASLIPALFICQRSAGKARAGGEYEIAFGLGFLLARTLQDAQSLLQWPFMFCISLLYTKNKTSSDQSMSTN